MAIIRNKFFTLGRVICMNIELQISGLVICILLHFFYKSKKTMGLYSERLFFRILTQAIVLLIFDILSVVTTEFQHLLPNILVELVTKTYLITLLIICAMAFVYILFDGIEIKTHRKVIRAVIALTLVASALIYILPIQIYHQEHIVYCAGPAVNIDYAFASLFIISSIFTMLYFRNHILPRRLFAFSVWMVIWVLAEVIQFFDRQLLLSGFAAALGVLILFVLLENPESHLNKELGCFNTHALMIYLREHFDAERPFSALGILKENIRKDELKQIRAFITTWHKEKDVFIFKDLDSEFVIITHDMGLYAKLRETIRKQQGQANGIFKDAILISTANGLAVRSEQDIAGIIHHYATKIQNSTQSDYMEINEYNIQDYFKQNEIKQDITNALIEDRVEAFFQPIYSTKKKKFTTAEALMRIRQENGTLLPPNLFIPVAESTGLIMPLGERIFEKVCRFLKESNIRELGIEYIEINLSIVQCEQDDLAERLIQIMKQYEIPASWINLEITESATYNSKRKVLKNISKLRDHGIEFSLDDFGKGQSNLMYMVEMPVSIVKLDMDLSKAYFSIPKAKNVVDSVAEMAHGMGLKLVAEGIETKEELEGIVEPGIDYIQGFYFSKPLPEAEFLEFIAEKNAQV